MPDGRARQRVEGRFWPAVLMILAMSAAPALAQDQAAHQHDAMNPAWQWSVEGAAFGAYNYQHRKLTDFEKVESQNWLMAALQKSSGAAGVPDR